MPKKTLISLLLLGCIAILIFQTSIVIQGVREGIETCLYSVIPSLFPFFFLMGCLVNNIELHHKTHRSHLLHLCGIPDGAGTLCLLGVISGYPVGAKMVYDQYVNGSISNNTAKRLLGFVNLAGPAFIFGVISRLFDSASIALIVWLIQISSAILVAILLPKAPQQAYHPNANRQFSISRILENSIKSISLVCGWVIVFRIIINLIAHRLSGILNPVFLVVLSGIFEMTNGCLSLINIDSLAWRFVLCNIFLAFGGLCVWMQIASVTHQIKSNMFPIGKILQTAISGVLALIIQCLLYPYGIRRSVTFICISFGCIIVLAFYLYVNRNNSRNADIPVV